MRISDWSSDVCSSDLRWFRFIGALYAHIGLSRPLATYLAQRLQTLLINRIILLELSVFLEFRLASLLGDRLTVVLGEIVKQRLSEVERHLDALRLHYPRFARDLDHAVLDRHPDREEVGQIQPLREAGIPTHHLARPHT